MDWILTEGLQLIRWLQSFRTEELDLFFKSVSHLGGKIFLMALIPLIWWNGFKELGVRLFVILMCVAYSNDLLKTWIQLPRPFEQGNIEQLVSVTSYSFPSNHSQAVAAIWLTLILALPQKSFAPIGFFVILLVGISRSYLGVHYPSDVVVGWLLGFGIALLFHYKWNSIKERFTIWSSKKVVVAMIGGTIFLSFLTPHKGAVGPLGALAGVALGLYVFDMLTEDSTNSKARGKDILFVSLIGMAGLFIQFILFSKIEFSNSALEISWVYVYSAFMGLWVSSIWPFFQINVILKIRTND